MIFTAKALYTMPAMPATSLDILIDPYITWLRWWSYLYMVHPNNYAHGYAFPDNKVHGAYMGPTWGRQDPGGPHVGPMNFAIWVAMFSYHFTYILQGCFTGLWQSYDCPSANEATLKNMNKWIFRINNWQHNQNKRKQNRSVYISWDILYIILLSCYLHLYVSVLLKDKPFPVPCSVLVDSSNVAWMTRIVQGAFLVNNNHEYRYLATRYSLLSV